MWREKPSPPSKTTIPGMGQAAMSCSVVGIFSSSRARLALELALDPETLAVQRVRQHHVNAANGAPDAAADANLLARLKTEAGRQGYRRRETRDPIRH